MLVEILSGIQVFLCIGLIILIYVARPDTSGLSSLAQNFGSSSRRQYIRFRPITKLIFFVVVLFFGNSILLNKVILSEVQNHASITSIISKMDKDNKISDSGMDKKIDKE